MKNLEIIENYELECPRKEANYDSGRGISHSNRVKGCSHGLEGGGHSFVELAFKSGLDLRFNNGDG